MKTVLIVIAGLGVIGFILGLYYWAKEKIWRRRDKLHKEKSKPQVSSAVIKTTFRIWWKKVGIWQARMVAVTWATFFLCIIIGDTTEQAILGAAAAASLVYIVAAGIVAAAFAALIFAPAATDFIASAFAAAAAIAFAASATTQAAVFVDPYFDSSHRSAAFIVSAFAAAFGFAKKTMNQGISKKAIWLSYMAEFLIILIPMLLAL